MSYLLSAPSCYFIRYCNLPVLTKYKGYFILSLKVKIESKFMTRMLFSFKIWYPLLLLSAVNISLTQNGISSLATSFGEKSYAREIIILMS